MFGFREIYPVHAKIQWRQLLMWYIKTVEETVVNEQNVC